MFLSRMSEIIILFVIILHADKLKAIEEFPIKDEKFVLSPAELLDLVWEEQNHSVTNSVEDQTPNENKSNYADHLLITKDLVGEKEKLKKRKVWSRWSKWSKCSVSCGSGTISRRRVCVAGRCAPGEREEQRRACALEPCAAAIDMCALQDDAE